MDGEFYIVRNQVQLRNALQAVASVLPSDEKPMAVKVEQFKTKRTELQNRYLWGWVYVQVANYLADKGTVIHCEDGREVPYTKDILHEIFKTKFLVESVIESKGRSITMYRSTTNLTTKQFAIYADEVTQFVWQFWKFMIPVPDRGVYAQYAKELKIGK